MNYSYKEAKAIMRRVYDITLAHAKPDYKNFEHVGLARKAQELALALFGGNVYRCRRDNMSKFNSACNRAVSFSREISWNYEPVTSDSLEKAWIEAE